MYCFIWTHIRALAVSGASTPSNPISSKRASLFSVFNVFLASVWRNRFGPWSPIWSPVGVLAQYFKFYVNCKSFKCTSGRYSRRGAQHWGLGEVGRQLGSGPRRCSGIESYIGSFTDKIIYQSRLIKTHIALNRWNSTNVAVPFFLPNCTNLPEEKYSFGVANCLNSYSVKCSIASPLFTLTLMCCRLQWRILKG